MWRGGRCSLALVKTHDRNDDDPTSRGQAAL